MIYFFIDYLMKIVKIVMVVKKIVMVVKKIVTEKNSKTEKKIVTEKNQQNNQGHLNHRSLKGLIIKIFYNHFQNSIW